MCGIAGFFRSLTPSGDVGLLKRMGEVIRHRGPDACGEYLDDRVGLSHRRLSILDLSQAGNQPMASADQSLMIVFNGEIYNFPELRRSLEVSGVVFRSRTDTEVILALYQKEGAASLKKLNGMFALALWDKNRQTILLARDRIGKKPLYYYHDGGDRLAFASEIKSLLEIPEVEREVEPTAVADYLKYLYIPAPKTIYRKIYKLPPAHCLELRVGGEPRLSEYWDVDFSAKAALSAADAEERLLELLQDATSCRMMADVPLGAFLSGGVDSSAVVALMSRACQDPVKTCSIGFADRRHDETPYAREVAGLFGTQHREYRVSEDLAGTVSVLPKYFDEPFADSSALPTYHVCRLARESVTVALAGDGGDESFAGYQKYAVELKEDLARRTIPTGVLSLIGRATGRASHPILRKARSLSVSALLEPGAAYYRTNTFIEDRLLEELLSEGYRRDCSGYDPGWHTARYYDRMRGADHVTAMLYTDLKSYLPGDILVKVDRMSMAHSLEVRAPFLDYRIVEFAATLPSRWKISGEDKKIILRKTFARLLPQGILDRPKQGFTVPLEGWFRSELREFAAEALFDTPALAEYLDLVTVRRVWDEHQAKRRDHGTLLWSLLMLSLWHREYREGAPCSN